MFDSKVALTDMNETGSALNFLTTRLGLETCLLPDSFVRLK